MLRMPAMIITQEPTPHLDALWERTPYPEQGEWIEAYVNDGRSVAIAVVDYEALLDDWAAQQEAEIRAENAWLVYAERPDFTDRDMYPEF